MAEEAKLRGNEAYKKGNYTAALKHYSQAISLAPTEANYYGNRSAALVMLQRFEEALEDCTAGLRLQPDHLKLLTRAGKCCLALGRVDDARGYYSQAVSAYPDNESVRTDAKEAEEAKENEQMYLQCRRNEQYPQASTFLDRLLAVATHSPQLKLLKVELMIDSMQPKEALEYIATLPQTLPGLRLLRGLALHYSSPTISTPAKEILQDILRTDPENDRAKETLRRMNEMERLKNEGNRHFTAGRSPEALAAYNQALDLDPHHKYFNSTILANRAAAYMKQKDYLKALEDCNRSITLNPDYTKAYLRRANVHMQLEDYDEAVHDYNKVKDMDPTTPEIDDFIYLAKDKAKKRGKKDYYQILGVEKTVPDDALKRAYRQLALKWHPDKNSETPEKRAHAEKMFKDVNEAYAVLSDREKRRRYDMGMDVDGPDMGMGGFAGFDPSSIFQMFFNGGGGDEGFGGMPFGQGRSGGFGGMPFDMFHQAGGGQQSSFPGGMKFTFKRR